MARRTRPTYRIVEAAERVGVRASTLRAWERRYGIPRPARSDSGYRLYSDIDLWWLARMKALVGSGVAAHEAARQVLVEQRGTRAPPAADADVLRERLLDSACAFDAITVDRVLAEATRAYGAEGAVRGVIAPALVEVGTRWLDGRIDIAHEHWLVQRLRNYLASLAAGMRARRLRGAVVVACFPDEDHDVACYILAVHLASRGFRPVVLGARTPPEAIAVAVRELAPAMVCLSLTNPPTPADRRALLGYKTACAGRPLWVGGQGVAALGALPRGVRAAGSGAADLLASLSTPRRRGPRKPSDSHRSQSSRAASPPARRSHG